MLLPRFQAVVAAFSAASLLLAGVIVQPVVAQNDGNPSAKLPAATSRRSRPAAPHRAR
jgi:hypothetical protein